MVAPWNKIDEARRKAGITQKEMASLTGVSETAVQKWRRGGSIAYETLVKLAGILDTTPATLLDEPAKLPIVREPPAQYACRGCSDLAADRDHWRSLAEAQAQTIAAQAETIRVLQSGVCRYPTGDVPAPPSSRITRAS